MNRYRFKKRGTYSSLQEYVKNKTGKEINQLNQYPEKYYLEKIPLIGEKIKEAMKKQMKIYVYTDYDVDGITSAAQIAVMFNYFQYPCTVKIPMRFTDGYGIRKKHTEQVDQNTLLLLIDNGISAIEAVREAKKRGAYVIIMDHHTADQDSNGNLIVPDADILLDPEALPDGNDFCDYCGSGITNKLINYMIQDKNILSICSAFAALGTVADVVPLREDNRKIVQEGLYAINKGNITRGLHAIVDCLQMTGHVTSEDISYYLAPLLNASGRLYDKGGTWSAMALMEKRPDDAVAMAKKLKEINQERKDIVKFLMDQIKINPTDKMNVICLPDGSPEGCLGLIAGKLTEETGKPSFVYTKREGMYKGSARSDNEQDNQVHLMLAGIKTYLASFGGHPGAAGFSFSEENESIIKEYLLNYPAVPHDNTPYYDLSINPENLVFTLNQMDLCEPFGKGMEKPVFRIPCYFQNGDYWKSMGEEGTHIRFNLPGKDGAKAVGFSMKERYLLEGAPRNIYLYGYPVWNWFRGQRNPQFMIIDFEKI